MEFVKVHGAGNDFVLLPDLEDRFPLTATLVRAICRPHLGLGADGVIRVAPPRDPAAADVFMDYYNGDGTVAEMCGNGVRCVAKYVVDRRIVPPPVVRVDTRAGVKPVVCALDRDGLVAAVRVDMGPPALGSLQDTVDVDGERCVVTTLSMGNPHAVLVVDDVAQAPVERLGPRLARHPRFPDGTNVEFIAVPDAGRVVGRIWERGVGETLASGTGASAMAAAAHALGLAKRSVDVELPGGVLHVDWEDDTLFVTGPAVEVASGVFDERWLHETEAT